MKDQKDLLLSPNQQRIRAFEILEREQHNTKYLPIDYTIDDECRRVLGLPPRPMEAEPYVNWMVGRKIKHEPPRRISQKGIDLIKRWEGFRKQAYLCPAKVWTIGYGHTQTAKRGMIISEKEAERLLEEDLLRFEEAVGLYVKVPLTQGQFDALVSFTFNVGIGAFKKSTLLKFLNKRHYQLAALELHKWVHGGGKKLPGLVSRRNDEYDLFTQG